MKILVIGVSSKKSIGYLLASYLQPHEFVFADRAGKLGEVCDITDPALVEKLIGVQQPDVVIHAAGCYTEEVEEVLGHTSEWKTACNNILAKAFGSLAVLDAAVRHRVRIVVFLGG